MKIKLIPETEAEEAIVNSFEHDDVRDIFIFGNKVNDNGELEDFHFWKGNSRYLMGSMNFFYNELNDERRLKKEQEKGFKFVGDNGEQKTAVQKGFKKKSTTSGNIKIIDTDNLNMPPPGFDLDEDK